MQILRQCNGHTLLIKLFASRLYSKRNEREWLMIAEDATSSGGNNGYHLFDGKEFCYKHLPSLKTKQCFVYSCLFPKDSTLEREEDFGWHKDFLTLPREVH